MLLPVICLAVFMSAITAPGLIALHIADKQDAEARKIGEKVS